MKRVILLSSLFIFSLLNGQAPAEQWQNTIGGNGTDGAEDVVVCSDGGFLLVGWSNSGISADKTEDPRGGLDYWLVKVNSNGVVQWDKTIGGSLNDEASKVIQTQDGGFAIIGRSSSDISGEKTENSQGLADYWIVKVNETGTIQWQNTIGGNDWENAEVIIQTTDGGYLVGGNSLSNISGDKTEDSNGEMDIWILKLNSNGDIVWQNTIGGSGSDTCRSIRQTNDGGYIIAATSNSGISGDKTENSLGGTDYWILKLDGNGNIAWQNTIGGNGFETATDVQQTNGGYVVTGYSDTDVNGDKTDPTNGGGDYWVLKLDNSGQNILWQNSLGGSDGDFSDNITETADGFFIVGGSSGSEISGDKTEPNVSGADMWALKLTSSGDVVWDKTLGSFADNDEPARVYPTNDNGVIYFSSASWQIFGDKTEEGVEMSFDYWLIKLEGQPLSVVESNSLQYSVYPNPTDDVVRINLSKNFSELTTAVFDTNGRKVFDRSYNNRSSIELSLPLPAGVYLLKVEANTGETFTVRILKQ